MDFRRAFAALLTKPGLIKSGLFAVSLTVAAALAAQSAGDQPLREANWIVPVQRIATLTQPMAQCQRPAVNAAVQRMVDSGELAFRTPLLLGGQAARAGLSCNSCHINGRTNPGFSFPGLSGAPGSADVTSSILSSHRGDGVFNPKRIPDLALDPPTVAADADDRILKAFLRGLIVEEFDGPEPSAETLAALAAFVRHQGTDDCKSRAPTPASVASETRLAGKALTIAASDPALAKLSLAAARAALGRMYERFPGSAFAREQAAIVALDDRLHALQQNGGSGTDLQTDLTALDRLLQKAEPKSLYNPKRLAKALK